MRLQLKSTRITIHSDHEALKWNLNLAESFGRHARWRLSFFKLEFDVVHGAAVKHRARDALSRFKMAGEDNRFLENDLRLLTIDAPN